MVEPSKYQYYRHRYGGLYRVVGTGFSTIDKSQHVIYKHMYPFDQDIWIRPYDEWTDGRFTLLTRQQVGDILSIDREQLKQEIAANKKAAGK